MEKEKRCKMASYYYYYYYYHTYTHTHTHTRSTYLTWVYGRPGIPFVHQVRDLAASSKLTEGWAPRSPGIRIIPSCLLASLCPWGLAGNWAWLRQEEEEE